MDRRPNGVDQIHSAGSGWLQPAAPGEHDDSAHVALPLMPPPPPRSGAPTPPCVGPGRQGRERHKAERSEHPDVSGLRDGLRR